jgi:glycosyltransferase involved in cell wall biosynthesis
MKDFHENKVSIIIPVHNSEEFLEECVESTLNQTYPDIEIIAVDDGSTDNSLKILKKYSNKIKIVSIKNCRVGTAFNQGIKIAKGELIKPLDSDDVLYPNAVENLITIGKNVEDKKNTMLYGHLDHIDSSSEIIDKKIEPNYNNLKIFDFNAILLDHMIGHHGSSLIHRSTFEEYGLFDESIPNEVDSELWLRYCILHNCRLKLVPKTIVKYRIHSTQLTITTRKKHLALANQIRNSILEKLDSKDQLMYEKLLLKYKKNRPLILRICYFIQDKIVFKFPSPIVTRIKIFVHSEKGIVRKFIKF